MTAQARSFQVNTVLLSPYLLSLSESFSLSPTHPHNPGLFTSLRQCVFEFHRGRSFNSGAFSLFFLPSPKLVSSGGQCVVFLVITGGSNKTPPPPPIYTGMRAKCGALVEPSSDVCVPREEKLGLCHWTWCHSPFGRRMSRICSATAGIIVVAHTMDTGIVVVGLLPVTWAAQQPVNRSFVLRIRECANWGPWTELPVDPDFAIIAIEFVHGLQHGIHEWYDFSE